MLYFNRTEKWSQAQTGRNSRHQHVSFFRSCHIYIIQEVRNTEGRWDWTGCSIVRVKLTVSYWLGVVVRTGSTEWNENEINFLFLQNPDSQSLNSLCTEPNSTCCSVEEWQAAWLLHANQVLGWATEPDHSTGSVHVTSQSTDWVRHGEWFDTSKHGDRLNNI
jgi:hypothetical protein